MEKSQPYILFELAKTTYGIPSQVVRKLELLERITTVPNAPHFVEGVVFSGGQVIPAINLRRRFGFEKIPYDIRTRTIVVQIANRTVGLIVDTAREFVLIAQESVQPPPETVSGLNGKYLSGIANLGEKVVLILNVEELLQSEQLVTVNNG